MIQIGPYSIHGNAVLAPMAGITDFPFRRLCKDLGASLVTGEMAASDPSLRDTPKSRARLANRDDAEPRIVQIVGSDPYLMAEAARYQADNGAQIIDINMGCPAKKVCRKLAGSALLKDEKLVRRILESVVGSVTIPVTLKTRTGWDQHNKNAIAIAKMAEDIGIQALAIHGRTRACKFLGHAEYDTIAQIVHQVNIPVFANGDINSATQARRVLSQTAAAGIMIGRASQGRPWIFLEINGLLGNFDVSCALFTGKSLKLGSTNTIEGLIINHVRHIHQYYGVLETTDRDDTSKRDGNFRLSMGIRVARKHVCWYFDQIKHTFSEQFVENRQINGDQVVNTEAFFEFVNRKRSEFNQLIDQNAQLEHLEQFFGELRTTGDIAA